MTDIKDLVAALQDSAPDPAVKLRQGTVQAINGDALTVTIGGSSTAVTGIKYLNSYSPTVADTIWLATDGRDWMALGKLGTYSGGGGGGGSAVFVQDTAPPAASANSLWVRSTDMAAFIRYNDGDSTQWVEIRKADDSRLAQRVTSLESTVPLTPNYIINGAFEINQRGLTSTTSAGYWLDRWWFSPSGGTVTHSVQTSAVGAGPTTDATPNYARIAVSGQSAASDLAYLAQRIEGVRTLAGQTVTVSFWAKAASGSPKMSVELNQWFGTGGSSETNTPVGPVTLSTSWTRYTFTATVPNISGKTIGTADFLNVILWCSAGSTYAARSSSIGVQNNTFDIWGVQVEAGPTATPFRRNANSLQGELAACQRYYWRLTAAAANASMAQLLITSSTNSGSVVKYPVQMRATPTLSGSASSSFAIGFYGGIVTPTSISAWGAGYSGVDNYQLYVGYSPGGLPSGSGFLYATSAGAYLDFSAEL